MKTPKPKHEPASSAADERARYLRRHHAPDPELEGLSPSEAVLYKKQAKADFEAAMNEMARLRTEGFSNYDAAELLLGVRFLESTIRGYRNPLDLVRYPRRGRRGVLTLLEAHLHVERLRAFSKAG